MAGRICTWLVAIVVIGSMGSDARAQLKFVDDRLIDSVMYRDPELPVAKTVSKFGPSLAKLWAEALARPEKEMKCQAAIAIASAHPRGVKDLQTTIPLLVKELEAPDQHPSVLLAVAHALVVLDAKSEAGKLLSLAAKGMDYRELIDPALARWDYAPAREGWLKQLQQPTNVRSTILAMKSLQTVKETKAIDPLRQLVKATKVPKAIRVEASRILGELQTSQGEELAESLVKSRDRFDRLLAASLLRKHQGDKTVNILKPLIRDGEPAVALIAIARLLELDPKHLLADIEPMMANGDAGIRSQGVEVMTRLANKDHLRRIGDALNDPHPRVRLKARASLLELAKKEEWKATVIAEGMRIVQGENWAGQEQAAALLVLLDHKPASTRLVQLLRSNRPEVLITVGWGLRRLAVKETLPGVLSYFQEMVKEGQYGGDRKLPAEALDLQLSQLAQFMGLSRYHPADKDLQALIPATPQAGPETRAAATWSIGLLREGKPDSKIINVCMTRLKATGPYDVEDDRVRRMAAITAGRMKSKEAIESLQMFILPDNPSINAVASACEWAVSQITGQPMRQPGIIEQVEPGWFLAPLLRK
jgi:hypothetical protein